MLVSRQTNPDNAGQRQSAKGVAYGTGKWRRRGTLVLLGLALAGVTTAESCEEATEDLEDISGENDKDYAKQIKQVQLGMTKQEVKDVMGQPPRDKQSFKSQYGKDESWYYGSWQLNFVDGQ